MFFVPLSDLWSSSIGIIGLAFNLRSYDFILASHSSALAVVLAVVRLENAAF